MTQNTPRYHWYSYAWVWLLAVPVILIASMYLLALGDHYYTKYEVRKYPEWFKAAQESLAHIRITLSDADGTKLPPEPDMALNNATIAGIDSNNNYIRDDVERKIFEMYPIKKNKKGEDVNLKLRAAVLQYAQSQQMILTQVDSEIEMDVTSGENSRAYGCIADRMDVEWGKRLDFVDSLEKMILNTVARSEKSEQTYKDFFTGTDLTDEQDCDL